MNKTSFEQQVDGALRFSFFVKLCGTVNNWHESCLTGMQHEVLYISALRYICQQNLDYDVEYDRQRWASAILVRTSAIPQYCGQPNRLRNCRLKKVAELRLRNFKI